MNLEKNPREIFFSLEPPGVDQVNLLQSPREHDCPDLDSGTFGNAVFSHAGDPIGRGEEGARLLSVAADCMRTEVGRLTS